MVKGYSRASAAAFPIFEYYVQSILSILAHFTHKSTVDPTIIPPSFPSSLCMVSLGNRYNLNVVRQLPKAASLGVGHVRQVLPGAQSSHWGGMRPQADLDSRPHAGIDQRVSQGGAHPIGTGQRVHHQIFDLFPK